MKRYLSILFVFLLGCDSGTPQLSDSYPEPPLQTCPVNVIWEAPTLLLGDEPLSIEDIERFTIYVATSPGKLQRDLVLVSDIIDSSAIMHRIDAVPVNSYIYMTVTDTDGRISPLSVEWFWDCVVGVQVGD